MRVLVEQSAREARKWIKSLSLDIPVTVLMGGVEAEEWFLHPEKPAILIGTQDMLLSRALNRGYSASRFHWPIDFGLLNNDCLWVYDEPQLMAGGVSTSAQLAGMRQSLGTFGECPSVWMSATLEPGWLDTIDFRGKFPGDPLELDDRDYDPDLPLHKRMTADKTLARLGVQSSKDMKDVAKEVLDKHQAGTQTLVVLNTVNRAKAVFAELEKLRKKSETPELLLIHSRFRPREREFLNKRLTSPAEDRIIVATQVVEAGVDISSRTLITELAPWASIVQRIGRCNRTGDDGPGRVFWIDLDEKLAPPYSIVALEFACRHLEFLEGKSVSPRALDEYKRANEKPDEPFLPFEHKHVLRRRDLLDLFDTSPDLSGNDIDIQRFVRSDDPDTDVQVFWRTLPVNGPTVDEPSPDRRELCNVPVGSIRGFLKEAKSEGFYWDHIDGAWRLIRDPGREIRPGLTILLATSAGGYDWDDLAGRGKGWDESSKTVVTDLAPELKVTEEASGSDPLSERSRPLTIAAHTQNVWDQVVELLSAIEGLIDGWSSDLRKAVRGHDAGKAHDAFQEGMRRANPSLDRDQLWAKSGTKARLMHGRRYFRHELASALAAIQRGLPFSVAYLIAAHHGRARLAIRALPGEEEPKDPETLFALGVHHGDRLPTVDLGGREVWHENALDLSPMSMGGESSWTGNALKLLAELGPFKLAYLEALLRAVNVRASRMEAENA